MYGKPVCLFPHKQPKKRHFGISEMATAPPERNIWNFRCCVCPGSLWEQGEPTPSLVRCLGEQEQDQLFRLQIDCKWSYCPHGVCTTERCEPVAGKVSFRASSTRLEMPPHDPFHRSRSASSGKEQAASLPARLIGSLPLQSPIAQGR